MKKILSILFVILINSAFFGQQNKLYIFSEYDGDDAGGRIDASYSHNQGLYSINGQTAKISISFKFIDPDDSNGCNGPCGQNEVICNTKFNKDLKLLDTIAFNVCANESTSYQAIFLPNVLSLSSNNSPCIDDKLFGRYNNRVITNTNITWQYSTTINGSYTDIPNHSHTFPLTYSLEEIFGENQAIILSRGGSVYFRLKITAPFSSVVYYSNKKKFDFLECSPSIVGVPTSSPTSCQESNDGGATFVFDDNIDSDNIMRYYVYEGNPDDFPINNPGEVNPSALPNALNDDKEASLTRLGNGHYQGSIGIGLQQGNYYIVYQEMSSDGSIVKSGGKSAQFTVGGPTALVLNSITSSNIVQPVCRDDKGRVTLGSSGGSGLTNLEYNYSKGNSTSFSSSTWQASNIFTGLDQGATYYFKARKRNSSRNTYCESAVSSKVEIVRVTNPITINPTLTRAASQAYTSNASSKEGSIRVQVSGGTAPYTFTAKSNRHEQSVTSSNLGVVIPNLNSGIYTITVKDRNNCSTSLGNVVVTSLPVPKINFVSQTDLNCHNDTNGTQVYTLTNANTSDTNTYTYHYRWYKNGSYFSEGDGKLTLTDLGSGSYQLRAAPQIPSVSANAIFTNSAYASVVVSGPIKTLVNPPLVSITGTPVIKNISCKGDGNGSITISVSGGVSYQYALQRRGVTSKSWVNLPSNKVLPVSTGGYYNLFIRNEKGCEYKYPTEVLVDEPEFNLTFENTTVNPATSYNGTNGSINITMSGGYTGTYTYTWAGPNSFSANTKDINGLKTGDYKVVVRDREGCIISKTFYVGEPNQLTTVTRKDVTCNSGNDGAITVMLNSDSNGTQYTYSWDDGVVGHSRTGLQAGSYEVTITGTIISATGNKPIREQQRFTLTEPAALAFNGSAIVQHNNVYQGSTGAIDIAVKGGNGTYTYQWTGPNGFTASTQDINALSSGDYTVVVQDGNSLCTKTITRSFYVKEPNKFTKELAISPNCANGCGGRIEVELNDDFTDTDNDYIYTWSDGVTGATRTGLCSGAYTVTVSGSKNGEATKTFTLVNPSEFQVSLPQVLSDAPNGVAEVSWTPTSTNGKLQINTTNGVAPITYIVTDVNGTEVYNQEVTNTTTHRIEGLVSGTYKITVKDGKGCDATIASIVLPSLAVPDLSLPNSTVNKITCYNKEDGRISFTLTNANKFHYRWYKDGAAYPGDSFAITNLSEGSYVLESCPIIKDKAAFSVAESIKRSAPIVLTNPDQVTLSLVSTQDIECEQGFIRVAVTGGTSYEYSLNGSDEWVSLENNTIPITNSGQYTVKVRNESGCESSSLLQGISVDTLAPLSISFDSQDIDVYGEGSGAIDITVTGGDTAYNYSWTGPASFTSNLEDITNLVSGDYTVVVTDGLGCRLEQTIYIKQPNKVAITSVNPDCRGCNGSIQVVMNDDPSNTNNYIYKWSDGFIGTTRSNLCHGTYNIVIEGSRNGINEAREISLALPAKFEAILSYTDAEKPLGVLEYPWTPTSANGKLQIETVNGTAPLTYLVYDSQGQEIYSEVVNSTAPHVIENLKPDTYKIIVKNNLGCEAIIDAVTLPSLKIPELNTVAISEIGCYNASDGGITFDVPNTDKFLYRWFKDGVSYPGTTTIQTNLSHGTYVLEAIPIIENKQPFEVLEAIIRSDDVVVKNPEQVLASLVSTKDITCKGAADGEIILQVSGGDNYQYSLDNGQNWSILENNSIPITSAGVYNIVIKNAKDCLAKDTINNVRVNEPTIISLAIAKENASAYGFNDGKAMVAVTGGTPFNTTQEYTYQWLLNNEVVGNTQQIENLGYGTYTIKVTDANGCSTSSEVFINQPDVVENTIVQPTCYNSCNGSITVLFNKGEGNFTYTWNDNVVGRKRENLCSGTYTVSITGGALGTVERSYTLINPEEFTASLAIIAPNKPQGILEQPWTPTSTNGKLKIATTKGVTPFTYVLLNSTNQEVYNESFNHSLPITIENLLADNYTLKVTDAKGCISTIPTIELSSLLVPEVSNVTTTPIRCYNQSNGSITFDIPNTDKFVYRWFKDGVSYPGSTSINTNLSHGTYYLEASPIIEGKAPFSVAEAIVRSRAIELANPEELIATLKDKKDISCHGSEDGEIALSLSGGTSYEYSFNTTDWFTVPTDGTIAIKEGGIYTITVRSGNCYSTSRITGVVINEPSPLEITITNKANATTFGSNNGAISIEVTGGSGNYSYQWSNQNNYTSTNKDINNLASGIYTITVTDGNGCTVTKEVYLGQPDKVEATVVEPTCYNGCDGAVSLVVNEGYGTFTYLWSDGKEGKERFDLCPGEHTVTIGNLPSGNTIVKTYTIVNVPQIGSEIPSEKTFCKNQEKLYVIEDADTSLTYLWKGSEGFTANGAEVVFPKPGTYELYITNEKGCTRIQEINIKHSKDDIVAKFAMGSYGYVGEEQLLVNISHPYPETTEWILPREARILKQSKEEVVLTFEEEGTYTVGLQTTTGSCVEYSEKKLIITKKEDQGGDTDTTDTNTIKNRIEELVVYPNPTNGIFKVKVELTDVGYVHVEIYNLTTGSRVLDKEVEGEKEYEIDFDIQGRVAQGIYILNIETPYGNQVRKIIVQ